MSVDPPPPLTLFASSLLSKWGFGDGDVPDAVWDVIDELDDPGLTYGHIDWRDRVLPRLVREYLLPVLDQEVEVIEIGTSHNPIRATSVNGVDVEDCWYGDAPNPTLTPDAVDVPMADVIRICRDSERRPDGAGARVIRPGVLTVRPVLVLLNQPQAAKNGTPSWP